MNNMNNFDELENRTPAILDNAQEKCSSCAARYPIPQATGNLQVDPEIHLPSPGMDVKISYYYNSSHDSTGPWGYGRTISTNLYLTSSGTPRIIQLVRGNGSIVTYKESSPGVYISGKSKTSNNLILDDANRRWIETASNGEKTVYPVVPDGQISRVSYIDDSVGNRHTYSYDPNNLLTTLTDAVGREVIFNYTNDGLLSEILDWAGRKTKFIYNHDTLPGKPLLIKIIGPTGCQTLYGYNNLGLLNSIQDPNGYETRYEYDNQNRIILRHILGVGVTKYNYDQSSVKGKKEYTRITIDALGNKTIDIFNSIHQLVSEISPMGQVITYNHANNSDSQINSVNGRELPVPVVDSRGNVISETDANGLTTTYTYDSYNNRTSKTLPYGVETKHIWGYPESNFDTTGAKRRLQIEVDAYGNETRHTYNPFGLRVSTTDPQGRVTKYIYDKYCNLISQVNPDGGKFIAEYDSAGNAIIQINPLGAKTQIEYDARDRPTQVTDALGGITKIGYDGNGNTIAIIDPLGHRWNWTYNVWDMQASATTPLGFTTKAEYDKIGRQIASIDSSSNQSTVDYDADGKIISRTNPLGSKTTYEYDQHGNQTAIIDALGNKTTFLYDEKGHNIGKIDALGNKTIKIYDSQGKLTETIDALGNKTTILYDLYGRKAGVRDALGHRTRIEYDKFGHVSAITNKAGEVAKNLRDADGRIIAKSNNVGAVTKYAYDLLGQQILVTDALGNVSKKVFDPLGRVVETIDPLGNSKRSKYDPLGHLIAETNELGYTTHIKYDADRRKIAVIDANGNKTEMEYGTNDYVIGMRDPLGASTYVRRNAIGNLMEFINAADQRTNYLHDTLGRETERIMNDSTRYAFTYNPVGRKISEDGASGLTHFVYDPVGKLSKVSYPNNRTLGYEYDAVGNRMSMTDPDGGQTLYFYDPAQRLISITNPQGEATTIRYDSTGKIHSRITANGVTATFGYDLLGRELNRVYKNKSGAMLASFSNEYDAAGRRICVTEHDNGIVRYAYDASGQLVKEQRTGTPPLDIAYAYDPLGNRLTKTENGVITHYAYNAANAIVSQIPSVGAPTHYDYDASGRLVEEKTGSASILRKWDAGSRLMELTDGDGSVERYGYLANGDRVSKSNNVTDRRYLLDGRKVVREEDHDGIEIASWTSTMSPYGGLISEYRNGQTQIFGFDASSNTRFMVDEEGQPVSSYVYDAFGKEESVPVNSQTPFRFGGDVGYGHESDDQYYVRARYLDVETGRWNSRDPIDFLGNDWNLYRYVKNSPVNSMDPSGLVGNPCAGNKVELYCNACNKKCLGDAVAAKSSCSCATTKSLIKEIEVAILVKIFCSCEKLEIIDTADDFYAACLKNPGGYGSPLTCCQSTIETWCHLHAPIDEGCIPEGQSECALKGNTVG